MPLCRFDGLLRWKSESFRVQHDLPAVELSVFALALWSWRVLLHACMVAASKLDTARAFVGLLCGPTGPSELLDTAFKFSIKPATG